MNATQPQPSTATRTARWPMRCLAMLVIATCIRVWSGPWSDAASAQTQGAPPPFDATAQRKEVADELRKVNATLEAILQTLRTGTLNVRMQEGGAESAAPTSKKK